MNFPSLGGNWVDLVILIILLYFLSVGWTVGFWVILSDFFSFLLSLLVALRGYQFTAGILRANFSFSHSASNAIGFLFTAIVAEVFLGYLLGRVTRKIPFKLWRRWWSKVLATVPAVGEGLVLIAFGLTLVLGFPVSPKIKADVAGSKIGGLLVRETSGVEAKINEIFGGVIEDSLTYLTIEPGSREAIPITVGEQELKEDEVAEVEMFKLVNEERKKLGTKELIWEEEVVPVARAHAKNMWEGRYFGHVSPGGEDVGDRLDKAEIDYKFAGENLALAPTISTAHTGLMNSEGHRKNILETKFRKVGIGVIDNGIYGKMFVQIFTD